MSKIVIEDNESRGNTDFRNLPKDGEREIDIRRNKAENITYTFADGDELDKVIDLRELSDAIKKALEEAILATKELYESDAVEARKVLTEIKDKKRLSFSSHEILKKLSAISYATHFAASISTIVTMLGIR